ncbi:type II secretion system protein [bacterium]|nr:type II secretion system protein [bacterium]
MAKYNGNELNRKTNPPRNDVSCHSELVSESIKKQTLKLRVASLPCIQSHKAHSVVPVQACKVQGDKEQSCHYEHCFAMRSNSQQVFNEIATSDLRSPCNDRGNNNLKDLIHLITYSPIHFKKAAFTPHRNTRRAEGTLPSKNNPVNCFCEREVSDTYLMRVGQESGYSATNFGKTPRLLHSAGFTLAEVLITIGVIGVVAALTIPSLMSAYRKHLVETRLKHSYALLNQVVKMSQADNDEISGWDMNSDSSEFLDKYILPYMKSEIRGGKVIGSTIADSMSIYLLNGVKWIFSHYYISSLGQYYYMITIDINGDELPNKEGLDRFKFYIIPEKYSIVNTGNGNSLKNVPEQGIYYDGYGFDENELRNNLHRGCDKGTLQKNAFCIALIVRNNWKIPHDYPLKF